ncbi:GntR family transcriptional regulator, partial [candidate division TA06 bacterium]|nr:GntR family transcriptional regulator [candidate division TA06 bacterium]
MTSHDHLDFYHGLLDNTLFLERLDLGIGQAEHPSQNFAVVSADRRTRPLGSARCLRELGKNRRDLERLASRLEEEGLIRKEPGRGTFVSDTATSGGNLELDRSIEDLISMGQATSVQLLELRETEASAREARDLKMPEGTPILRCKRLRLLDNQPYCYIVNHVPIEIGRRIPESNWH